MSVEYEGKTPPEQMRSFDEIYEMHDLMEDFKELVILNDPNHKWFSQLQIVQFAVMSAMLCWMLGHENPQTKELSDTLERVKTLLDNTIGANHG